MANRKLKSLKFPGIDDTYILDAGNVNYSDEETYEEGSVGEGLNALKEDFDNDTIAYGFYTKGFEQGGINLTNGADNNNYPNVRIRSKFIPMLETLKIQFFNMSEEIILYAILYDESKAYVATVLNGVYVKGNKIYTYDDLIGEYSASYIRIWFSISPERNVSASEWSNFVYISWESLNKTYNEMIADVSKNNDEHTNATLIGAHNLSFPNVYDMTNVFGGYITGLLSNGLVNTTQTNYKTISDFIVVDTLRTLRLFAINVGTITPQQIAFYDTNKQFISQINNTALQNVTYPTGTKYIKYSITLNQYNTYLVNGEGLVLIYTDSSFTGISSTDQLEKLIPAENLRIPYLDEKISDVFPTVERQSFNAAFHTGLENYAAKCSEFASTLINIDKSESFMFVTDSHVFGTLYNTYGGDLPQNFVAQLQKYYNSAPCNFIISGGDWIDNSDSVAEACYKLSYIGAFMRSMFKNCYMLVGNHDTNYQGAESLSIETIKNLWYKGNQAYYKFNGTNTRFYCFDSRIETDNLSANNKYFYKQAKWFAESLTTDSNEHIAIATHILYNSATTLTLHALASLLLDVARAYNNRSAITVDDTTYNFSDATGKIEFLIAGHTHVDGEYTINGIPCVVTTNAYNNNTKITTFDFITVDYDNNRMILTRVGTGSNRTVSLT